MIPLARPTVPPVAITIFTWKMFSFAIYTNRRTDHICENSDHYREWLGLAEWIKKFLLLLDGWMTRTAFSHGGSGDPDQQQDEQLDRALIGLRSILKKTSSEFKMTHEAIANRWSLSSHIVPL